MESLGSITIVHLFFLEFPFHIHKLHKSEDFGGMDLVILNFTGFPLIHLPLIHSFLTVPFYMKRRKGKY